MFHQRMKAGRERYKRFISQELLAKLPLYPKLGSVDSRVNKTQSRPQCLQPGGGDRAAVPRHTVSSTLWKGALPGAPCCAPAGLVPSSRPHRQLSSAFHVPVLQVFLDSLLPAENLQFLNSHTVHDNMLLLTRAGF